MCTLLFFLFIYLSLKCGAQLCGRNKNKHALAHNQKTHSDEHNLAVNSTYWAVWCYKCNLLILLDDYLLDLLTFPLLQAIQLLIRIPRRSCRNVLNTSKRRLEKAILYKKTKRRKYLAITALFLSHSPR